MRPKIMWHLLHRYLASRLQSLRLGGYLFSGSKAPQLSTTLVQALGLKCPNLTRLYLHVADLRSVPLPCLPASLRVLELHSCEIPGSWLSHKSDSPLLQRLQRLVLHRVPSFGDEHLVGLAHFQALRTLVLGGTYRVTETGLSQGLRPLGHLQHLEVRDCTLTADAVLRVVRECLPDLRVLHLSVRDLSTAGLVYLSAMAYLEHLCFLGPPIAENLPSPGELLNACQKVPTLKTLEICGLDWEQNQEAKDILQKGLPHCQVSVRAYNPESRDWWM
ncbi:F-box/LRR-repeat protein 12 [Erinaceus europaeus]|uniref:F-box/LRR-repeat protein 12 n=1 Tax=Erinaceus europaeus TaxID=9365 RepID=A0ABM3WMB7_ERIEU|nr:F-box/LRR-repeat protein 12 [Erinaceus europaeus]